MNKTGIEIYQQITNRKLTCLVFFSLAIILTFIIDIMTGPAGLTVQEVITTILNPGISDKTVQVIVWTYRLPIALMAVVVGAALGVAGAEMQTILDNPLASPYTLGVSAAAGFGAALAMVVGVGLLPLSSEFLIPLNAFVFSLLCCLILYSVSRQRSATSETMVLAGIALLFLFSSLIALLEFIASPEQTQAIVFWMFGSLMKATFPKVQIVIAVFVIIIPLFALDAWKLTALRLGDDKARSLGINVEKLRLKSLVLISLLTATAVCFVGTIGFIGLVAPHIARMLVGEDQRFFMPFSAITGALLLSSASIISKLISPGMIFPVGIITSLIGIPFFIWLIMFNRRSYW